MGNTTGQEPNLELEIQLEIEREKEGDSRRQTKGLPKKWPWSLHTRAIDEEVPSNSMLCIGPPNEDSTKSRLGGEEATIQRMKKGQRTQRRGSDDRGRAIPGKSRQQARQQADLPALELGRSTHCLFGGWGGEGAPGGGVPADIEPRRGPDLTGGVPSWSRGPGRSSPCLVGGRGGEGASGSGVQQREGALDAVGDRVVRCGLRERRWERGRRGCMRKLHVIRKRRGSWGDWTR